MPISLFISCLFVLMFLCAASIGYIKASGTSFATPIVTALVGLLRYENPDMTAEEVKEVLVHSCYKASHAILERVAKCGGVVSATKAFKKAGLLPSHGKRKRAKIKTH